MKGLGVDRLIARLVVAWPGVRECYLAILPHVRIWLWLCMCGCRHIAKNKPHLRFWSGSRSYRSSVGLTDLAVNAGSIQLAKFSRDCWPDWEYLHALAKSFSGHWGMYKLTSCYGTASQRPHHCCKHMLLVCYKLSMSVHTQLCHPKWPYLLEVCEIAPWFPGHKWYLEPYSR